MRWKLLFFLIGLQGVLFSQETCSELNQIDGQIQSSKDQRDLLKSKAYRLDEQANRWQFRSDFFQDARRAWQQADVLREAAGELDEYIVELEGRKSELLKENPECKKR